MGAPSLRGFAMDQTFLGYKASDKIKVHEQLFNLLWVGEGRWNFDDIYNLPLNIRSLWISKIKKIRSDEQKHYEKTKSNQNSKQLHFPNKPIKK